MRRKPLWAALFLGLLMLVAVRMDLPSHLQWGAAVAGAEKSERSTSSSRLDVIIIDNDDYDIKRRGPVTFTHLKHAKEYGVSCWNCHHEFDDNVNVWVPWSVTGGCSDCHDPRGDEEMYGLQKAYHVSCRGCHQSQAEQNKKTGPHRGCFGCHEREQK
jgi:predicted CXXCH cytochrome family protein